MPGIGKSAQVRDILKRSETDGLSEFSGRENPRCENFMIPYRKPTLVGGSGRPR